MALQRRVVATNTDGGVASLTAVANKPAATAAGDLIVVAVGVADDAAGLAIAAPDGTWTQQTDLHFTAVGAMHLSVFTKTAGSSEPASWSFTITGSTGGANDAWCTYADGYYSDAAGGTAGIDQKATSGQNASAPQFTTDTITPSADNCRVLSIFDQDQSGVGPPTWTANSPVGLTKLADFAETVTNFGVGVFEETQTTAAATSHTVTSGGPDTTRGAATAIISIKETITVSVVAFLVYGHTGLDRIQNIETYLNVNIAGWLPYTSTGLDRLANIEAFLTSNPVNSVTFLPYGKTGTDRLWNIESYLLSATGSSG